MSLPVESSDDLGIESFEDVYQTKYGRTEEEGTAQLLGRGALRTAARVGETLIGLPGEIRDLARMGGDWLGNKARAAVGKEPLTEEETTHLREKMNPASYDLLGRLAEALPTSSSLREDVTRAYTGEYLEPQNEWERFADNVAQDFAALAIPIKGKIPFARSLGQAVIANAGGEVANAFFGEKGEAYTKMGLLFSLGMLSGGKSGGIKKYINGLYGEMEAAIPAGAEINASRLSKKLNNIESILRKGDPKAASKAPAFQKIEAIRNKINSGMIDIEEVVQLTKDTNEAIFGLGELKRGQNELYNLRKALHDSTKEYGASNPEFLKKWQSANEAYAATETSRRIGNYVKKNIRPKDYVYAASALGLEGTLAGGPAALSTLGGTAGIAATAYGAEVIKRISKSKALQKYYKNVVIHSLNQNKGGLVRAMTQLDKALEDSFKKEPYESIEFDED